MTMNVMYKVLYRCLLLQVLVVVCNLTMPMAAANNDEETDEVAMRLLEQTVQKNLSLGDAIGVLNQQIKDWNDTIKSLDKKLQKANISLQKQQKQLEKLQLDKDQEKETALLNRQQELQAKLDNLKYENDYLEQEIDSLKQSLGETSKNLEELEGIKQGVAEDFVNKNEPYLENLLSKMNIDNLQQLHEKCDSYQGDRNVKSFSKKLEHVLECKEIFDAADAVDHQPFDREAINNALKSMSKLNHLSDPQAEEVENLRKQLASFETGLIAFKDFITQFQKKRKAITSSQDVGSEVERIRKKKNEDGKTMAWRIENEISQIPYLKKKFDQYMKAIQANPKKVPDVENEILKQCENNIKQ